MKPYIPTTGLKFWKSQLELNKVPRIDFMFPIKHIAKMNSQYQTFKSINFIFYFCRACPMPPYVIIFIT